MQLTSVMNKPVFPASSQTGRTGNPSDMAAEKVHLRKAAREMESLFLYQLLKTMRSTIPESEENGRIGMSSGLGKDVYTEMFDQELAGKMAGRNRGSIADQIYRSMEKYVDAGHTDDNKISNESFGLPSSQYIKIIPESMEPLDRNPKTIPIDKSGRSKFGLDRLISRIASRYDLDPKLIKAVIKAESNGDPKAVSSAGAKGLMQLIDSTATDMGVRDVFDPAQNIEGGARYLRKLIDEFGDIKLALAAYNAGPETVKRYGGIPPYAETINYVRTVWSKFYDRGLNSK
jgi:Rod binding domain-containing protein